MPYLAAIDDNESPALTVYTEPLLDVALDFVVLDDDPDTLSTWLGKIKFDFRPLSDFNLAIEIPYLWEIDHTDSPLLLYAL